MRRSGKRYAVREDLTGKYQQRTLSAQVDTLTLHKGSFGLIGRGQSLLKP